MKVASVLAVLVGACLLTKIDAAILWTRRAPILSLRRVHPQFQPKCTVSDTSTIVPELSLEPPPPPSGREIRKFALPALGLWLSSPLLSLIDTSAVGLAAPPSLSATQLAALGPATTLCDGTQYLFAFLNVATTSLYASELARSERAGLTRGSRAAEDVVRLACRIALTCGVAAMLLLLVACVPMLTLYIGADAAANTALLASAVNYVRVRILSLPAALLGSVLSAALLGARDSLTPLLSTGVASAVNVLGDVLCVAALRRGLAGAAAATLLAQYAGTAALLRAARARIVPRGGLSLNPLQWRRAPEASSPQEAGPLGTPSTESAASSISVKGFLRFAAPVLTLVLGKLVCFGFMTSAAARLGEIPLAVHQLTLSTYFFLSPNLEVISQTAQSFLPQYIGPPEGADAAAWRRAEDRLALRLLRLSLGVACAAAAAAVAVPLWGARLLTSDPTVISAMVELARPLGLAVLLTGPVCASEGVLLARRMLRPLSAVYLSSVLALPLLLSRAHTAAQVWTTFMWFQLFRGSAFTLRLWLPRVVDAIRQRTR